MQNVKPETNSKVTMYKECKEYKSYTCYFPWYQLCPILVFLFPIQLLSVSSPVIWSSILLLSVFHPSPSFVVLTVALIMQSAVSPKLKSVGHGKRHCPQESPPKDRIQM